jgi:putative membrane-bound dehydrogenase-like protein
VAPGFRVTVFADETLANDTYAMTLDARGRVVVTTAGSVTTLHDTDGDGKADKATPYATTPTGGMGLCFDGDDLLFCGDGWLSRYRDADGDGKADGPPERIIPLQFAEHGGHAMRKGPDGWWYVIGGNDSGIGRGHIAGPHSPVRDPEAGALLRLSPDFRTREVVAHGFRNPYDFDFNPAGDLFTYDSDCERDYFLPWYTPTRIDHVAHGGHHGWRLTGYQRSWARRDDYPDVVDILWPVGRGSPTGVACYRHDQFPPHYRGGVFVLDWTFGKVFFFALEPSGTTYRTRPEVFLEPIGTNGFAPTDAAVAPDGTLFVSIGGRRTRGAVYRVEYVGEGLGQRPRPPATDLEGVLRAPQPLDAWSRARWEPVARRLGAEAFAAAVADESKDDASRIRAVEVLTELFGGAPAETARALAKTSSSPVRARLAWSLGRAPCRDCGAILAALARDPAARVRLAALDALADRSTDLEPESLQAVLVPNLADGDKRIRQAAARLASRLPEASWSRLGEALRTASPQARLSGVLATLLRDPREAEGATDAALDALGATDDPGLRFQAVRLIARALGDYALHDPPVEVYTAYALAGPQRASAATLSRVRRAVRPLFPSGHGRLDEESARLLAMLEDDDPALPRKVAAMWTEASTPTRDMHYLIVFSRLRGPKGDLTAEVAKAVLNLDRKLSGQELRTKQTWGERLSEVTSALLRDDPRLADALLRHPDFVRASHVALALGFTDAEAGRQAARRFLDAARQDPDFEWSGPLIDLLSRLPASEVRPALRARWDDLALRDAILLRLADGPEPTDRDKFLAGLDSSQPLVVRACLAALAALPRDPSPENLVPVLRLLRRLLREPHEKALRSQALALLARQSGRTFAVDERGAESLTNAYRPVIDWFERAHPTLVAALNEGDEDPAAWSEVLKSVDWSLGRADRGEAIFRSRGCHTCHSGPRALGPDLNGVTRRFSRDDLFAAIIAPNRDVAPAYRTTLVETRDGRLVEGMLAFESADGLILQTGAATTLRIATPDIASRRPGRRSLMPSGLLKGLSPRDLADLHRYLQTLGPRGASGAEAR